MSRHDLEAERAVLAEVLLDHDLLPRMAGSLSDEDFYAPEHATIWRAMLALRERGARVDGTTLPAELRAMNRLNTVGGTSYLAEITDAIPTTAHWEDHVAIVAEYAAHRRAHLAARQTLMALEDERRTPSESMTEALRYVVGVSSARQTGGCRPVLSHAEDLWSAIEAAQSRGSSAVPTGLRALDGDEHEDGLTGGLWPGQLWTLAAPPAGGKTALAMQLALSVARTGAPVLVVSQEMPGTELLARLAGAAAGIPASRVRAGRFSRGEPERFAECLEELCRLPLEILDTGRATPSEVRAQALRIRAAKGRLGLIVVDYLQILRPDHRDPSQVRELSEMTRDLKTLPIEAKCPLLLLSQFSRDHARSRREPALHDLKGSGSIEADSDVVVFLHPDKAERDEDAPRPALEPVTLIVAKHRQGPTGRVKLTFNRPKTRFEEDAPEREQTIPATTSWTDERYEAE